MASVLASRFLARSTSATWSRGTSSGSTSFSEFDPITGLQLLAPNDQIFTGTGNSLQGVLLGSTNATIGSVEPEGNNVITGNGLQGVSILPGAEGNQVIGNQIGIAGPSLEGRFAIAPNGADGVLIAASSNVVGGATAGSGNLISANQGDGVHITGAASTEDQVEGNYIGVGPGGGFDFGAVGTGNGGDGVLIENASDNTVGGSGAAERNVISANQGIGVAITGSPATGNTLQNNYIGLTSDGAAVLGNAGDGVAVFSAGNVIGPGNVISANVGGVLISGAAATGNQVLGNLIGTDATGEADLGNAQEGVLINGAANNFVTGDGNGSQVITGNNDGVVIVGATSTGNIIQGNLIGTDKAGTVALGNSLSGVSIASAGNTLGGTSAASRNVISANNWGVIITGSTTVNNVVQGNFIGTDITGKIALGNEIDGVLITQGASANSIGGTATTGAGNTIAFNVDYGVNLATGDGSTLNGSTGNSILSNKIFGNGSSGINIPGDGDLTVGPGPNNLQSYPDLTTVIPGNSSTTIDGMLQSTAGTAFLIQFFSTPAGDQSGQSRRARH